MTIAVSPGGELALRLAFAILSGLALAAGYSLHPIWWAPWLAPVPLIVAGNGGGQWARIAGAIAGIVAIVGLVPYYLEVGGWLPAVVIVGLRIVYWMLISRIVQAAARRLPLVLAMLAPPVAGAALELLALVISPHGAAGSLAYSQMDMPALFQAAALGGVPAVVFVILLPGSFVGLLLARSWPAAQKGAALALQCLIAAGLVLFTAMRLGAPAAAPVLPVIMIATDQIRSSPRDWSAVWDVYRPAVEGTARPGSLIVLPEKIALLDGPEAERAALSVAETAKRTGGTVIVGIEVRDAGIYRNRALVAAPDGRLAWYDKQRPVPGLEARDVPGKAPLLADLAGAHVGVAICKDMHIPSIGREYAGGAALMAVPAWDFGQDGWMGARMTAMRAVENGYAIARSARNGFVGAYDRTGRVLVERPTGQGITVVEAALPAVGHETLYARVGDLFGWVSVAALAILIGWLRRPTIK